MAFFFQSNFFFSFSFSPSFSSFPPHPYCFFLLCVVRPLHHHQPSQAKPSVIVRSLASRLFFHFFRSATVEQRGQQCGGEDRGDRKLTSSFTGAEDSPAALPFIRAPHHQLHHLFLRSSTPLSQSPSSLLGQHHLTPSRCAAALCGCCYCWWGGRGRRFLVISQAASIITNCFPSRRQDHQSSCLTSSVLLCSRCWLLSLLHSHRHHQPFFLLRWAHHGGRLSVRSASGIAWVFRMLLVSFV